MAQAIIDPDEVRRFATELKRFNDDLRNQMKILHGRMTAPGQTWRDQEQAKFSEEFEETMKVLLRVTDAADRHSPGRIRKAERAEEDRQQR